MAYLDQLQQSKHSNYQKLFYFTSPEHILDTLKNSRLKVSTISKCNDIFELGAVDLRSPEIRSKHRNWVENSAGKVGFICMSADWRSHLMWGHYARNGTGVCLVLEVEKAKIREVCYIKQRQIVPNSFKFPDYPSKAFRDVCCKKSNLWAYEKEYRFFVDLGDTENVEKYDDIWFLKLNHGIKIAGFINGPKPDISRQEIISAFGEDLDHFQCRASLRDFRLVVQQSKGLWK